MQKELQTWYTVLQKETKKKYFKVLYDKIRSISTELCPHLSEVFRVYETPLEDVKVVILGLDPSPDEGDSGLAFSSNEGKVSSSLNIIFNELLKSGLSTTKRTNGDLSDWSKQGVFLLNTILTTTKGKSLAHSSLGWQQFTGATLKALAQSNQPIVFMIWGDSAEETYNTYIRPYIKGSKLVLKNYHPMAEVYRRHKFTESNHFVKANRFLLKNNVKPIIWDLILQKTTDSSCQKMAQEYS